MKVSIITICFNSERVIAKTIESVLNQTYKDIEYIIVDGKSSDNTVKIAKRYSQEFSDAGIEYRIISEPDNGIYDAMNKGIQNSTGELIGIINSGDWYENTTVETAVNSLPYDLFYADINLIKTNGNIIVKHSKMDIFPSSRHWNHPTMFVAKKVYEKLGLYRCEGIHDDFEFFLRCRKANCKIAIKNCILANFETGGASNIKSIMNSKKRIEDRYKAYRQNGYSRCYIIECIAIEIAKFMLS